LKARDNESRKQKRCIQKKTRKNIQTGKGNKKDENAILFSWWRIVGFLIDVFRFQHSRPSKKNKNKNNDDGEHFKLLESRTSKRCLIAR